MFSVVIEIVTFRVKEGTNDAAFCRTDEAVQQNFFYAQPGMLRRTTARSGDGQWAVLTYWDSAEAADAAAAKVEFPAGFASFGDVVDMSTLNRSRFEEL